MNYHPQITVSHLRFGAEQTPVVIVDNFAAEPEQLIAIACDQKFAALGPFFPGVRAAAPRQYQHLLERAITQFWAAPAIGEGQSLTFTLCHFSLVTTPPNRLRLLQRIPHFDSTGSAGLASVHYLFDGAQGGTAFYRHRKTGFETIDDDRAKQYFASLEAENGGADLPAPGYINGDTALFEQIGAVAGCFNRLVIYPRNLLHSGSIAPDFSFDADPARGRLSINSFIDPV